MKFSETLIDPLLTNSANYFYKYTENIKIKKYDDDCYIPPTLSITSLFDCVQNNNFNSKDLTEVGLWKASTCKKGNGVNLIRNSSDNNNFWQSDGDFPHYIEINFNKIEYITEIWIYLNYAIDESYTPRRMILKTESICGDIYNLLFIDIDVDPISLNGWAKIDLKNLKFYDGNEFYTDDCLATSRIFLYFIESYDTGKDVHLRNIKLYGIDYNYKNLDNNVIDELYSNYCCSQSNEECNNFESNYKGLNNTDKYNTDLIDIENKIHSTNIYDLIR